MNGCHCLVEKLTQILPACRLTFGMDYATDWIGRPMQTFRTPKTGCEKSRFAVCENGKKATRWWLEPNIFSRWFLVCWISFSHVISTVDASGSHSLCAQMQTVKQSTCLRHKKHSNESVISPMTMQPPETNNETLRHLIIGLLTVGVKPKNQSS